MDPRHGVELTESIKRPSVREEQSKTISSDEGQEGHGHTTGSSSRNFATRQLDVGEHPGLPLYC